MGGNGAGSSDPARAALGQDVVLVPRVGLTMGYELGTKAASLNAFGPRRNVAGFGLSYAF